MFARRFSPDVTELMDRPQPVSGELRRDLHNLERINRLFGGHAMVRRFLPTWFSEGGQGTLEVLDLATGAGDLPRLIVDHARSIARPVAVNAVDFNPATLAISREASRDYREIKFVQGDIRSAPSPRTYDVVLCSLALHHFSEPDAIAVLRAAVLASRRHVLVTDLKRSVLGSLTAWAITALWLREPMTRHDARMSVARAFSAGELRRLAEAAGWKGYGHLSAPYFRQAIWLPARI